MAGIVVGTNEGLHVFDAGGAPTHVEFADRAVTAVAPAGSNLWAIVERAEVWHSGAGSWSRIRGDGFRLNCVADTRAGLLVGTSEAGLLRVAGDTLERVDGFEDVAGRSSWYTPWGGPPDTRSISEDTDNVYVNVHVGGIPRSGDHGRTWEPTIDIDADVHKVAAAQDVVLAACARGLAVSADKGDSWTLRSDGLHASYCRSVAVCGDVALLTASVGPRGGRAAVYRGRVAGGAFERCREGLPEWFDENIDSLCLDALADGALAAFATHDGRVFASTDRGASWTAIATGLPRVNSLSVMP